MAFHWYKKAQGHPTSNPNDHVAQELAELERWITEQLRFLSSDQLHQIKAIIDANPPGGFPPEPKPSAPVAPPPLV